MDKKNIFAGILLFVVGLLVLLEPETCIKVVVLLLGVFSLAKGLYDLFRMRTISSDLVYRRTVMVQGLVGIAIGLIAVFSPFALFAKVQEIIRIMLFVLAVYLILEGFTSLFLALKIKSMNVEQKLAKSFVQQGLSSLLTAVILFLLPQDFGIIIVRALGCIFIIGAVIMLIYTWHNRPIVLEPDSVEDVTASNES